MRDSVLSAPAELLTASPRVARVSIAFEHDRTPPKEWVDELRTISPISEAHGFLDLVWEPGDPWIPGQRWMLYELVTPEWANPEVLEELRGPNPRSEGHMCSVNVPQQFQCLCRHKLETWRGGPAWLITHTQWKLFQRTGYIGRPFWVIQGQGGGHKAFFTPEEQVMLGDAGLPTDPPEVGSLTYAPFDGRVLAKIAQFNRLQAVAGDLRRYRKQMGEGYAAYREEQQREMRKGVVQWLTSGLAEEDETFRSAAANDDVTDLMARSDVDYEAVEDEVLETFVESGNVPDPVTLHQLRQS